MDPFSAEGELVNIHDAFHQGRYAAVASFPTSSFSAANALPVRVLQLRARLALGEWDAVLADVRGATEPDLQAVGVLAEYLKAASAGDASEEAAVERAKALAEKAGTDSLGVQLCCGTVLARAGLAEEALELLGKHQGSLDAVALIVQIHLQQNRLDLAQKETQRARKWAQDNLLVNLAESWVGLREGGEKYQAAYYVFEELAQASATQAVHSLLGQAVSELHLGRLPEAEAAFQQAVELDAKNPDLLANLIVLNTVLGKETATLKKQLEEVQPKHQLLEDLAAKTEAFELARSKYTPKFEP